MNVLIRKFQNFLRLPRFTLFWLAPVWVALALSKATIYVVPFRRIAAWLGTNEGNAARSLVLPAAQEHRAKQISHAISLVARYTFWNANCFPQAITARLMLGFYGIPHLIYFGLQQDVTSGKMKAHAWVTAGRKAVTGGYSFGAFTVVGVFANGEADRL